MRLLSTPLCAMTVAALLAACSGNAFSRSGSSLPTTANVSGRSQIGYLLPWSRNASLVPFELRPSGERVLRGMLAPNAARSGIYASAFAGPSILGYNQNNKKNRGPICTVPWSVSAVNGIAVDGTGALIEPDGQTNTIILGTGPGMCGAKSHTISDPYGQPSDAASADASNGPIVVGNIFDNHGAPGSVSVCTVAAGCTVNLTNPHMYETAGVALDKRGNCWVSAVDHLAANLIYFKKCTGAGVRARGFLNTNYGGLDIDPSGNLVSIDANANSKTTNQLWVYKGCNPNCTVIGGPFSLHGPTVFGHLNKRGTTFAAGDYGNAQVDVYSYSPTALTYQYSFSNGFSPSATLEGVAYNPRSSE